MEQTNASEEIIIQEIAMEVESEFQLGGLSDGLYFTFAAEVAKRYALLAVSKERGRIVGEVKKRSSFFKTIVSEWGDIYIDIVKGITEDDIINLINTK